CRGTGTYRIYASSKERFGSFTLVVGQQDAPKPAALALKDGGGRVESKLADEDPGDHVAQTGHCKVYAVQLEAGQVYRIDQVSRDFDSLLRLEDAAGKELGRDDNGGGELNSRLTFLCRKSGTYHVVATGIKNNASSAPDARTAAGAFTLTIERQEALKAVE